MSVTKLSLPTADAEAAQALAALLTDAVPAGAAVSLFRDAAADGWRVEAYCETGDLPAVVGAISQAAPQEAARLSVEALPNANWVAISQAALAPVTAGTFLVHGSHDRAVAGGRRRAIEIDAGEAFGTAHHASTRGCLVALDRLVRRHSFGRALDLGCGSGILAIAAARLLPTATILASDLDSRAVEVARANARLNRVAARIRFFTAAGLAHSALRAGRRLDLVLANILAEPLIELAPAMRAVVAHGGHVVLAGLLDEQSRAVGNAYVAAGFSQVSAVSLDGWSTLTLRRR
ncbi:MAG: 50S ribosomal protein L11 methyltransferase [Bacteroidota bacterium]|jgi:ribosomal protein L11 methyltransferase